MWIFNWYQGWGTRAGKQRFKCKNRSIFFTHHAPEKRSRNSVVAFLCSYILQTITYLFLPATLFTCLNIALNVSGTFFP